MTYPVYPPLNWEKILKIVLDVAKILKEIFKKPKGSETPDEIAERNEAFRQLCERINESAKVVETQVIDELERYAAYLSSLEKQYDYIVLEKFPINANALVRRVNLLKQQIPGTIASVVSRRLSDTDQDCFTIRQMMPGIEKEQRMNKFMVDILNEAAEKCIELTDNILSVLEEDVIESLQEAVDTSRALLEQEYQTLVDLSKTEEDFDAKAGIQHKAECVLYCCDLAISVLEEGKNGHL